MQTRIAAVACAALLGTGCAALVPDAERIEIQQGNLLSEADIDGLRTGLTRAEVRERVGAPVLTSPWRGDRWDYVYYRTEAGRDPGTAQRLTLYFDERDRVARIEDRYRTPEDALEGLDTKAVPKVETGGKLPVSDDRRTGPDSPLPQ